MGGFVVATRAIAEFSTSFVWPGGPGAPTANTRLSRGLDAAKRDLARPETYCQAALTAALFSLFVSSVNARYWYAAAALAIFMGSYAFFSRFGLCRRGVLYVSNDDLPSPRYQTARSTLKTTSL